MFNKLKSKFTNNHLKEFFRDYFFKRMDPSNNVNRVKYLFSLFLLISFLIYSGFLIYTCLNLFFNEEVITAMLNLTYHEDLSNFLIYVGFYVLFLFIMDIASSFRSAYILSIFMIDPNISLLDPSHFALLDVDDSFINSVLDEFEDYLKSDDETFMLNFIVEESLTHTKVMYLTKNDRGNHAKVLAETQTSVKLKGVIKKDLKKLKKMLNFLFMTLDFSVNYKRKGVDYTE